jgi:DNA repair protein RadC
VSVRPKPYPQVVERMELADADIQPQQRVAARQKCASTRAEYRWLAIDVCATQQGRPKRLEPVQSSRDAARVFGEFVHAENLVQELFAVLCLDARRAPIALAIPHRGALSYSLVEVGMVFKPALLLPAAALIVCHNHPSQDPKPSPDDIALTQKLVEAGRLLGVRVFDHIILAGEGHYFSFLDAGLMG